MSPGGRKSQNSKLEEFGLLHVASWEAGRVRAAARRFMGSGEEHEKGRAEMGDKS